MNDKWISQGFVEVDLSKKGSTYEKVENFLSSRIIGQPRAIKHVARSFQRQRFKEPNLPVASFLFAGPTGVGKTEMAKAIAQYFVGNVEPAPLIFINCENYQQDHEASRLVGAPPGYEGHNNEPQLSQSKISKPFVNAMKKIDQKYNKHYKGTEEQLKALESSFSLSKNIKLCLKEITEIAAVHYYRYGEPKSVILFDEIEKAHPKFWDFIMNIIEEGKIVFGNTSYGEASFANSIIIFTTNIGAEEIQKVIAGNNMGFNVESGGQEESNQKIYNAVKRSLEKTFRPEFLGRIKENIIVFHPLAKEDQEKVIDVHLWKLQKRYSKNNMHLKWNFTNNFKEFILEKTLNDKYGMRVIKQKIKKYIESPIGGAIETGQIKHLDSVAFDVKDGQVKIFVKRNDSVNKSFGASR